EAAREGAALVVAGELAITGYPPEDLVLRPEFRARAILAARELARITEAKDAPALLIGGLWEEKEGEAERCPPLFNAALLMEEGQIRRAFRKHALPNYDVFDEK